MKTFEINGKTYKGIDFSFGTVCDLEDMGIPMEDYGKKPRLLQRGYFALCAEMTAEQAGKEIEAHIIAGGNLDGITEAMHEAIGKSDFFRALQERAEKEDM